MMIKIEVKPLLPNLIYYPNMTSPDSTAHSIHSWIKSLSYTSFLNLLTYTFHRGGRSEKRRGKLSPADNEDEFEAVKMMLGCRGCMFRCARRSRKMNRTDRADLGSSMNGIYSNGKPKRSELPFALASILAEAGVHRSLNMLVDQYNLAKEDEEEEEPYENNAPNSWWEEEMEIHRMSDVMESRLNVADLKFLQCMTLIPAHKDSRVVNDNKWCLKFAPDLMNKLVSDQQKKEKILEVLRIVSRGHFLAVPPKTCCDNVTSMAWFDPYAWFSLSFYLVSQLEVGLWNEFKLLHTSSTSTVASSAAVTIVDQINTLEDDGKIRVWSCAIGMALKTEFEEVKNLLERYQHSPRDNSDTSFDLLRESLILQFIQSYSTLYRSTSIPLLHWNTPQSQLQRRIYNNVEESYSREVQRSLLEMEHMPSGNRKKKKKRRRAKQKLFIQINGQAFDDNARRGVVRNKSTDCHSLQQKANAEVKKDENQDCLSDIDDNDLLVESIIHTNQMDSHVASSPEKLHHRDNGSKMFALQMIDDIIYQVFQTVGLNGVAIQTKDAASKTPKKAINFLERQENKQSNQIRAPSPLISSIDVEKSLLQQFSNDELSIFDGAPLCLSGALDGYNGVACPRQEQDIFCNLLHPGQHLMKSDSTAASVASSEADDLGLNINACDDFDLDDDSDRSVHFEKFNGNISVKMPFLTSSVSSPRSENSTETPPPPPTPPPQLSPILVSLADLGKLRKEAALLDVSPRESFSSKVDFKNSLKESGSAPRSPRKPSSVISLTDEAPLTRNFSRDDLRSIDERRRPHLYERDQNTNSIGRPHVERVNRNVDALLSYRNVVAQSVHRKHSHDGKQKARDEPYHSIGRNQKTMSAPKPSAWAPVDISHPWSSITSTPSLKEPIIDTILHLDVAYARSECAFDVVEDASHCNVIPRAHMDDNMTKDGATTLSSVHSMQSPPIEEQHATVKEERDIYRDHCLILGAENAKLRNLLASKFQSSSPFPAEQMGPYFYQSPSYQFHFGSEYNRELAHHAAAMSDAGIHRGEHDSSGISEDGTDTMHPSVMGMSVTQNSISWQPYGDSIHSLGRRTSVGGTYAESDTSLEHNGGKESYVFSAFCQVNHQDSSFGPMGIPIYGMRSRLSQDMNHFMKALKSQLKRNESRRVMAVEQITKAVNAVWPRAQIKMYGSHVTRLCLPSSDMDFVICLPAVHKNAPAQAPGDLEGRNAINETNQKVLARKLKKESWLDQRSLKVIERTAVPVIKVSTKDSRSRAVQLDLSFDAREHHGLEALDMIQHILEELPVIRPLVLVLKQFLLDRGLLTAYTGGLSSYCLFLMVARYCQEQSPTWCDCGSLLMGLLDFYGNFFDPRTTGVSVGKRKYFSRSQVIEHTQPLSTQLLNEDQRWNVSSQQQFNELTRRNSFSDRSYGSGGVSVATPSSRFQMNRQVSLQGQFHSHAPQNQTLSHQPTVYTSGKPYTFDPIWVEDPLNPGNNVGRNAFRIFQVQRAFSDAHRALVAALEWDINSDHEFGDDGEYPLLKCLLQNEDVFYDNMRD